MDDDWTLTAEQALFMLQHHNRIEAALTAGDVEAIRELAASPEWTAAFGKMGFDEAYDRYECMLEDGDDSSE